MARKKDLVALAGLAGLAYAYDKSKNKAEAPKGKADTKDIKKVEAKDEPFKATHGSSYTPGNAGTARLGVGNATNDPIVKPPKVVSAKQAPSVLDPREAEAGMSRGTRPMSPPVSTTSSSEEGMKNYKPRRNLTPATPSTAQSTVSSSAEGMKNYVPRKPIYRQETQRERAESYVKKRREAQDQGMKSGGMASSAFSRGDGIASRGKTKCKMY
jgi:hypothetical protein